MTRKKENCTTNTVLLRLRRDFHRNRKETIIRISVAEMAQRSILKAAIWEICLMTCSVLFSEAEALEKRAMRTVPERDGISSQSLPSVLMRQQMAAIKS